MPYVAVAPSRTARGVRAPGIATKTSKVDFPTYDWRAEPDSSANTERIEAPYQVADLLNAMHAVYTTDAMFVCYLLRDSNGLTSPYQPRICQDAIPWLREQGYTIGLDVLAADCDLREDKPPYRKRPWTPEILDIVSAKLATLKTAGFYISPHGARVIQPLKRTVDCEEAGSIIEHWLHALAIDCAGDGWTFSVDFNAKDWTRHSAPPNTLRDGAVYHSPLIRLDRMMPVEPPKASKRATFSAPRTAGGIQFARTTSAKYAPFVPVLAQPFIVNGYQGHRHDYFLAMTGALLKRGVDPQFVPAVAIDVAKTAKLDVSRAYKDATDTAYRYLQGMPIKGMMTLPPELQEAVESLTSGAPRPKSQSKKHDKRKAEADLANLIRKAPLGLTLIQTPCGFGKTTAAMGVAVERAAIDPDKIRAPAGSKTAIAVPTHQKAVEVVEALRSTGTPVRRLFGPLSVKDPDGRPVCRFLPQARALQAGGQSVTWELCEGRKTDPCPHRDSCPAYGASDEDDRSRVYVGPHAMIAQLNKAAGASGLLVVDETPALTKCHTISEGDIVACQLGHFEDGYAAVMMVVLSALANWMHTDAVCATMREILDMVDPELSQMAAEAVGFVDVDMVVGAPPIKQSAITLMRASEPLAHQIGSSSKILRAISDMILSDVSRISLVKKDNLSAIVATVVPAEIRGALTRQGAAVMLDAGMSTSKPMVDAIVGHAVPIHAFNVSDGAPIARTLLYTNHAKRSKWLVNDGLVRLVKAAVDWILEDPAMPDVAIVSTKAVEDRLVEAMSAGEGPIWDQLSRLSRPPSLGHYHALRGLDVWKDLDAIVTIGDPYQNLDAATHDALISGQDRDELVRNRARDELEQAHGRLRVIHRTRPGRLAHVGGLAPGGWEDWETRAI